MSPEFVAIKRYFTEQCHYDSSVHLAIGDDCALIQSSLMQAISVDTSVADVHFPNDAPAYYIGARALNVSISDLAAMGATPRWFTLAISLPDLNSVWLEQFSKGLFDAAHAANIQLIGGDTTRSKTLSITIQVQGELARDRALLRSGAKPDDIIYIGRELAGAAAGMARYFQGHTQHDDLFLAYMNPQPQWQLGQKLLPYASSCIDISDGLLADLNHILQASHCAACIDCNAIALSPEALRYFDKHTVLQWALGAGDDYALCFTSALPADQLTRLGIQAYAIGQIQAGQGFLLENAPENINLNALGFDHFNETSI